MCFLLLIPKIGTLSVCPWNRPHTRVFKLIQGEQLIFWGGLFIVFDAARCCSLIPCGRRLSVVRLQGNLVAKVKTWMGLKGLQETRASAPHPVSPSLSEKTLSICHSVFQSVHHFLHYRLHQSIKEAVSSLCCDFDPHCVLCHYCCSHSCKTWSVCWETSQQ